MPCGYGYGYRYDMWVGVCYGSGFSYPDPYPEKYPPNTHGLPIPMQYTTRKIIAKYMARNRKPQGRKQTNKARPAKYQNWHAPACWSQVLLAAKESGWKMSAFEIVRSLKRRDPVIFAGITRETVKSWIDRSGDKPRWTDTVLARMAARTGNEPGHSKGGRCGILV